MTSRAVLSVRLTASLNDVIVVKELSIEKGRLWIYGEQARSHFSYHFYRCLHAKSLRDLTITADEAFVNLELQLNVVDLLPCP